MESTGKDRNLLGKYQENKVKVSEKHQESTGKLSVKYQKSHEKALGNYMESTNKVIIIMLYKAAEAERKYLKITRKLPGKVPEKYCKCTRTMAVKYLESTWKVPGKYWETTWKLPKNTG